MKILKGFGALSRAYLIELFRSRTALFWNLAFPLLFVVGFGFIFAGGDPRNFVYILPGVITINLIAAAFFGISMQMVNLRENGVYRRYRVTPVLPITVVMAHAVISLFNILTSMTVQIAAAKLIFNIEISRSIIELAAVCVLSAVAFIPLGLLIGSTAKDIKTAPALTNLIFFPMMFLSGAAMPLFMMPDWLKQVAQFLPATYVVEMFQGIIARGIAINELGGPAAILFLTGVVGFSMNSFLFRWESSEPVNKKNMALAFGSITIIYLAAFLIGPSLKSAEDPSQAANSQREVKTSVQVFKGMTIIDGLGNRIKNARMIVQGEHIIQVSKDDTSALPQEARVIDLSGKFIIPGLIDSHVHIGGSAGGSASLQEYLPSRVVRDLQAFLAVGVTTIVSLTDDANDLIKLREGVQKGSMRAPHIFFSGPSITAPGGHPAARFKFVPGLADKLTFQVSTPQEAQDAVQKLANIKVDLVKLVLEEGNIFGKLPVLSEAAFRAAIKKARALGLKTTVHVDSDKSIRLALDAGADGLEHAAYIISEETLDMMAAKGVSFTPTLVVFEGFKLTAENANISNPLTKKWVAPIVLESLQSPQSWLNQVRDIPEYVNAMSQNYEHAIVTARRARERGVNILAGSDSGNPATFHGPGLIRELELLVEEAGLLPHQAIIAATSRPAKRLGRKDIGRIANNAYADFLILDADPSQNIRALRDIREVYYKGKRLDRENILTSSPGDWMPGS